MLKQEQSNYKLKKEFENMKMKDNENLNKYFSRITYLVNQMKTYSKKMSYKKIVEKIMISLAKKFETLMAIVKKQKIFQV